MSDLWLTLALSLGIQALFFVFAATLKTDKVTDLSYGLTFIILAVWLLAGAGVSAAGPAAMILAGMVIAWGIRLAGYLLYRIITIKRDARFDGVREDFWKFLKFWFFQGLAVWVIMLPVILWFSAPAPWHAFMWVGLLMWGAGLAIETFADAQKFRQKTQPGGSHRWVDTGLWRYSRHPNYFGEILCWWGVFLFAARDLGTWALVGAIGPATLTALLLWVTGIPTLEASATKKWAGNAEYAAYRARTRTLVPWPRRPST